MPQRSVLLTVTVIHALQRVVTILLVVMLCSGCATIDVAQFTHANRDGIGVLKWHFATASTGLGPWMNVVRSSPAIDSKGIIYIVCSRDGSTAGGMKIKKWILYAVNTDGSERWQIDNGSLSRTRERPV